MCRAGPEFIRLRARLPVCTENLNPDVMVMQSAEYRVRLDIPDLLNGTKGRRTRSLGYKSFPFRPLPVSCQDKHEG